MANMQYLEDFKCPPEGVLHQYADNSKFSFLPAEDLRIVKPDWLVEEILESGSLGLIFGEPSTGKSFIALDLGACVATGLDWNGNKVQQGGVLYFAGEGIQGFSRRIEAWMVAHRTQLNHSMFLSTRAVDLNDTENILPSVREEIQRISQQVELRLMIVDTLSRHYRGDENTAADMSRFISVVDGLRQEFGFAVLLVHHSGKDNSRGARGSSVLKAAVDTEIQAKKVNDVISITNTKQKDYELFGERAFQLSQVELRDTNGEAFVDRNGNPITSCVLEETTVPDTGTKSQNIGKHQKLFGKLFEELTGKHQNRNSLKSEELRRVFLERADADEPSKRWLDVLKSDYFKLHYQIIEDDIYRVESAVS